MSGTSKKEELWLKRVGKRVQVDGVGFGMLRFFGAAGVDSQCGVELEEPLGAGDGDGYFSCADGHAMFAPMEQCTLVDAEGNPVKAKKKKVAPKKKFESPPSLRKTIRKTGSKTSTPKTGSSTKKRQPTKVDHLKARPKSQLHAGIDAGALEKRNIKRRSPPTVVVAPVAEEAGAPSAIGGTAVPEGSERPAFEAPEDWMEKALRLDKEKAAQAARDKEAADLAAQEARLAQAKVKEEELNALSMAEAEEEARVRAEKKAERAAKREAELNERNGRRLEAQKIAMAEIAEAKEANARAAEELDQRSQILQEKRKAQKARIAMMMSKVRPATPSAAPSSPPPVQLEAEAVLA